MTKSGPPTSLEPSEYEAIEKAMMETTRGRWFLAQFAERNRRQDTQVVLEAIAKLESSVSNARSQPESDRIKTDLVEMSKAIERTRYEIANLKLPDQEGGNLVGATEELDAIVSATERATNKILQAAEDIQETAWIIREDGGSIDASCARIDNDVTDIYTACSFQDITGQRTQKVVQVLTYLESRINAMVSIWGLATDDSSPDNNIDSADKQLSEEKKRPDAHLLNGPQMEDEALKQHHIDDVMAETKSQNEQQADIESLELEDAPQTGITPEQDESQDEAAETIEETSQKLQEDLQEHVEERPETSLENNDLLATEESLETKSGTPEEIEEEAITQEVTADGGQPSETLEDISDEPELPDELDASENSEQKQETAEVTEIEVIEEELSGLEENLPPEIEEEALAENLLSDLEEMATSAVEENLSIPESSDAETEQISEQIPEQENEIAETIQSETQELQPETTLKSENLPETDDSMQEQAILDHIENADLLPEDEEIKETILADNVPDTEAIKDPEENSDERAAFEQHFKKISEELQKAKQLKKQSEAEQPIAKDESTELNEGIETETPVSEEETAAIAEQEMIFDEKQQAEDALTEENSDKEFMENTSEAEDSEDDKTAEELRKLSPNKKSALFQ